MMKRIFGAKNGVIVMLCAGLAIGAFLLCFDMVAEGRERSKGKKKKGSVLVSEPKAKKAKEEENISVVYKKIKGEVGMITSHLISIIYKRDKKTKTEYEFCLSVDENLELVNKEELDQIKIGDTIEVRYEEKQQAYEETKEDGTVERKTKVVGRGAKKITFLSPKIKGVLSSE